MNSNQRQSLLLSLLCLTLLSSASALNQDITGSSDDPAISRFPGAVISDYEHKKFDEFSFLAGRADPAKKDVTALPLEGEITDIVYRNPDNRSSLEVQRNFEMAFAKNGFQVLFQCTKDECGEASRLSGYYERKITASPKNGDQRYVAVKKSGPDGTVHIGVYTMAVAERTFTRLTIVKSAPMETGLITITADEMKKGLSENGKVALYGLYFDTDKSEIKPESEPMLKEIAALLSKTPSLKLLVVGHTDNVGDFDRTLTLSRARADAVIKALTAKHGVAAARLKAFGAGSAAPAASNRDEKGRALNRRVELVEP